QMPPPDISLIVDMRITPFHSEKQFPYPTTFFYIAGMEASSLFFYHKLPVRFLYKIFYPLRNKIALYCLRTHFYGILTANICMVSSSYQTMLFLGAPSQQYINGHNATQ